MRYFGGKARISKELVAFLQQQLQPNQAFVDLFCGACNIVSKIKAPVRIANDIHPALIAMWKHVQKTGGSDLPTSLTREEYYAVKENGPLWLQGFVGFGCSFAGKWWGGYACDKTGCNYCARARRSTIKKANLVKDVRFMCDSYQNVLIPQEALVYCDIPYKGTTSYGGIPEFDHEAFYTWARKHENVYVSEYAKNVPEGATIVWRKKSRQGILDGSGKRRPTEEVLWTFDRMCK